MKNNYPEAVSTVAYFKSPQEAVVLITELLKKQDFKTLAKYYDLSSSKLERSELESGVFFIRSERPEVAHPAGFWRYKQPFAPGFKFNSVQPTDQQDIFSIEVLIRIDQGEMSPQQIGSSSFNMIKSIKGWQVLPD